MRKVTPYSARFDVLAQKRYIENALDAIVSVALRVFALLLGTVAWFCIAILFASSVIASSEKQRATLAFAFFMSSLTAALRNDAASGVVGTNEKHKETTNRRSSATSTTVEAIFMPALRAIAFVKLTQRNYLRVVVERRFRRILTPLLFERQSLARSYSHGREDYSHL